MSLTIDVALVKEQGVHFAVVVVQSHVLNNRTECNRLIQSYAGFFPGYVPILMAQDGRGRPTYVGRPDIVDFLASIPFQALPWKRMTIN